MLSLTLAAAVFAALHLGVSGTRLRDRLTARLGLRDYTVAFSLASVAAIAWLVSAYNTASTWPTWGQLVWWKPFAVALMLPAFLLVVIGLTTPNPTAVAQDGLAGRGPVGIVRITRHPFLVGTALWAAVHLVGNGDAASLLFFGSLLVVAAAGTVSIDAKRARAANIAERASATLTPERANATLTPERANAPLTPERANAPGTGWDGFARQTSILPFAAILAGRTTLSLREIGWWRPACGAAAYALMLAAHARLIGVSPWPQ